MFLTFSKRLSLNDDLALSVCGGHAVIPLNDAAMRFHLGRFIVSDVAFPRFVIVVFEPLADLGYPFVQGFDRLLFAFFDPGFALALILFPISPGLAQTGRTSRKSLAISLSMAETNSAMVVKCGFVSRLRAMKMMFSAQARAILRLEAIPRE